MTTEATLPSTSASPTARQVWTRARGIALAVVLLLAAAVVVGAGRLIADAVLMAQLQTYSGDYLIQLRVV